MSNIEALPNGLLGKIYKDISDPVSQIDFSSASKRFRDVALKSGEFPKISFQYSIIKNRAGAKKALNATLREFSMNDPEMFHKYENLQSKPMHNNVESETILTSLVDHGSLTIKKAIILNWNNDLKNI